MKKILLIVFIIISNQVKFYSQCTTNPNDDICRGVFAGLLFDVLYQQDNVYNYLPAYYPSPYIDLQETDPVTAKLKVLSYLQFDNGFSVFDYTLNPAYVFRPFSEITKIEATVFILEAYNISPDYSGSSPFDDIDEDDPIFGYANKAYDEGFVDIHNGDFNPYDTFTVQETLDFLIEVINSPYHPINEDLTNGNNYFQPGIYSPFNIAQTRGINQGVFSHYAKDSFVIPDVKFSLDFSHFYSTSMVELPKGFFKLKPLGTGWSHTYNAYIIREDNVGDDEIDYYFIVWPDGTIHIFNEDDNEYVSKGVYDELDEYSGGDEIRIRKKDQTDYRFEQLDSNEDIWYLIYIEDSNGNRIDIEYEYSDVDNDLRRIEYVEAPSGKRLNFHYVNNTDYLSSITDPIGREIFFDVDEGNDERLEKFTDAKGNETRYRYIENDENAPLADQKKRFLLDEIKLPRGNKITAEYDTDDAKLESYQIDNQPPVSIYLDFDFYQQQQFATVTTPVDYNSDFTEDYEFNINGLVTNYTSDTEDLEIDYPNSGVNVMLPTETNLNGVRVDYEYDNRGNVTEIDKENGDVVEEFDYDNDNNLTRYEDANNNETFFEYDSDENLTEIQDPLGNSITFVYDSNGQLINRTNQEGIATVYYYEDDGAVSDILMQENIYTHFEYDGINRLISKSRNGLTSTYSYDPNDNTTSFINSGGYTTSYDYDANDNLSTIVNANNIVTSFTYDDKDRVIQEQFGNLVKQYEYTEEGYLERYTKPSGAQINYEYDNDGRLEETGTITDFDYNSRNLVESVANEDSRYNFQYDNLNRLINVEEENLGTTIRYDYDDIDNVRRIYYPDFEVDFEVEYDRDEKNRITSIDVTLNGTEKEMVSYTYRDDDLIETVSYSNGISGEFTYDGAGRKTSVTYINNSGNLVFENTYILDVHNNVISEIRKYGYPIGTQEPSANETISYNYNDNNHITQAGGNIIEMDVNGNIQFEEKDQMGATNATDLNYGFDIDDRLISVQTNGSLNFGYPVEYKYDPYGNRISRIESDNGFTQNFVWDIVNGNVILEYEDDPIVQNRYHIWGPIGIEVSICPFAGCETFFIGDLRGSVVAQYNEFGIDPNEEFYRYDDFGKLLWGGGDYVFNGKFRYLGKHGVTLDQWDYGHYNMKARIYDAQLGRFISEDPVWSPNLYPYADNNPISKIDPNGKYPFLVSPFDIRTVSLSGEAVALGGFELGLHANFIDKGAYASACPIITGSFGLKSGFGIGGGISAGGSIYSGSDDFKPEYFNSNLFEPNSFDIDTNFGVGVGAGYSELENGTLVSIEGSAGAKASFTVGTTANRILFDFNKYNNVFGLNLCKILKF